MRSAELTIPELGLIAGTRGMLGAGIGLLLADRLSPEQRKATGLTLLMVGAITTIPLILEVVGKSRSVAQPQRISTGPIFASNIHEREYEPEPVA